MSYEVSRRVAFDERWNAALALQLGWMSDGQAELYFGRSRAGFSDLLLSGQLAYQFDKNASVFFQAAGVTVPDDVLAAALDQAGVDDQGLWFALGAAWGL